VDDPFGHWLAGFMDGEGYFGVHHTGHRYNCRAVLKLRADDYAVLARIREETGVGTLYRDDA
jgi:hypothetical protein